MLQLVPGVTWSISVWVYAWFSPLSKSSLEKNNEGCRATHFIIYNLNSFDVNTLIDMFLLALSLCYKELAKYEIP